MLQRANDRVVAAVLAAATALFGISRAGRHPFWLDEAFTAQAARHSLGGLVRFLGHEAGMGPYYLVLWGWARVGTSEGFLRVLSVVGGAFAVAATYLLAARMVGRVWAAVAAIGLACNPFFVYNLTELRAYSWTMWFGVVSVALCVRFRAEPSARRAIEWGVAVGLMLGALAFTAPLVVAEAAYLWPSRADRNIRRLTVVAALVALALFAPFVPALVRSDQIDWILPLTPHRFVQYTAEALGGYRWSAVLLAGNTVLAATLVRPRWRTEHDGSLRLVLGGVVAMPMGLAGLEVVQPVFIPRYLSAMLPLAIIGAVAGVVRLMRWIPTPARWVRPSVYVGAGLLLAAATWSALTFDVLRPEDLRAPARFVASKVTPGDDVQFSSTQVAEAAAYYWKPSPPVPTACRHWYFFRGTAAELRASLGLPSSDTSVTTTDFRGYTIGESDHC